MATCARLSRLGVAVRLSNGRRWKKSRTRSPTLRASASDATHRQVTEILQKIHEWGKQISEEEKKLAGIKLSDLEVISTEKAGGQIDEDPVPGYAIAPVRMGLGVDAGERTRLMHAIMLRDPRALLSLIVKAHRANRRIDVEFRFWRDRHDGPPFGKPGEIAFVFFLPGFVLAWHGVKTVCRILRIIPCCCAGERQEMFGNRKKPCCMATTHSIRIWCYIGISYC